MKKIRLLVIVIFVFVIISTFFVGCKEKQTDEFVEEITKYKLDVKIVGDKEVDVVMNIDYKSPMSKENIILQCYSLAYEGVVVSESQIQGTYPNGVNFGKTIINSIKVNGQECEYIIGNQDCIITIEYPIKYNEKVIISVDYKLNLAEVKHRLGYFDGVSSLTQFYPYLCPGIDGEYSVRQYSCVGETELLKMVNFDVKVTTPKEYVLAFGGEMLKRQEENGKYVYLIRADNVRDFALLYSKKFKKNERTVGDVTLEYVYYDDALPFEKLDKMGKIIQVYQEIFGKFGRNKITMVKAPVSYGGMEYSLLVTVSSTLKDTALEDVIAHELAHEWWFFKVGNDQAKSPWLDESLAEFSVAIYYLNTGRGNRFESIRQLGLKTLERRTIKGEKLNIKGSIYEFNDDDYADCVYTLGCLMWINYYAIKGPIVLELLKDYATKFDGKIATENDVSELVFEGYQSLMDGWLNGKVVI